jgi:hypothetical protein
VITSDRAGGAGECVCDASGTARRVAAACARRAKTWSPQRTAATNAVGTGGPPKTARGGVKSRVRSACTVSVPARRRIKDVAQSGGQPRLQSM